MVNTKNKIEYIQMASHLHRPEINIDSLFDYIMCELNLEGTDLHVPVDVVKIACTYWTELMLTPMWRFIKTRHSRISKICDTDNKNMEEMSKNLDGLFGRILIGYIEKKSLDEYKQIVEKFAYNLSHILLRWGSGNYKHDEYYDDYGIFLDRDDMYISTDYDPRGILLASICDAVCKPDMEESDIRIFSYIFPPKTDMRAGIEYEYVFRSGSVPLSGWWMKKRFRVMVSGNESEILYDMYDSDYTRGKTNMIIEHLENINDDYAQELRKSLITELEKIPDGIYAPEYNKSIDDIVRNVLVKYPPV